MAGFSPRISAERKKLLPSGGFIKAQGIIQEKIYKEGTMHQNIFSKDQLISIHNNYMVDYKELRNRCNIDIINKDTSDVSVIVPVTGRENFTEPLIRHINNSISNYTGKTYSITFVEHSPVPLHMNKCSGLANYIFIPRRENEHFNKCLAMNVGFIFSNPSRYYLFHDLDLLMDKNFFHNLFKNLERVNYNKSLQAFSGRRVVVMDTKKTNSVINSIIDIDSIEPNTEGAMYCRPGAPGGSIFLSRDNFLNVGGFDPEFFHSYSCEDAFFYQKLIHTSDIEGCDSPVIELFHMEHPRLNGSNNPDIKYQMNIMDSFNRLTEYDRKVFIKSISDKFKNRLNEVGISEI